MARRLLDLSAHYAPAELVEFKPARAHGWLVGYVVSVAIHYLLIRPPRSTTTYHVEPGQGDAVRALHGKKLVRAQEKAAPPQRRHKERRAVAAAPARTAPPTSRLVWRGPAALRPDPRPRPRARCAAYLAFARGWPCCACAAPAPSDAHHIGSRGVGQKADDYGAVPLCRLCHQAVTDTNALPGLDRQQTEILIWRTAAALLVEWCILVESPRGRARDGNLLSAPTLTPEAEAEVARLMATYEDGAGPGDLSSTEEISHVA